MEQAFDVSKILLSLFQAFPVWALVGVGVHLYLKKVEKNNLDSEKRLQSIEMKLDSMRLYFDELERRADTIDIAISFLMNESFSSKMIANGKGGWPRMFSQQPKSPKT